MKSIEELGISPTPWSENKWQSPDDYGHDVQDAHRNLICEMFLLQGGSRGPNASLIAAAPKLYEKLLEAINDKCTFCNASEDDKRELCDQCIVADWKEAIAEASGEEIK